MIKPLSSLVDLRSTSEWKSFDNVEIIQACFGTATAKALRYSENGKTYVIASHAIETVLSVTIEGEPVTGYKWYNASDNTGNAVAFLEIAESKDTGVVIEVELIGMSNNPADIINWLYPRNDLQDFRIYCANRDLQLNGCFNSELTIRAAITKILEQINCVWTSGMIGFADKFAIYKTNNPIYAHIRALDLENWTLQCSLDSLITHLTIEFDYNYATNEYTKSLVLEAVRESKQYGQRKKLLSFDWIKTAYDAYNVGIEFLERFAKPEYKIKFETSTKYRSLEPNQVIKIKNNQLPFVNEVVITNVDPNYGNSNVSIEGILISDYKPNVSIINSANMFDPIITTYSLQIGSDIRIVTITDDKGSPLVGAKVWIDNQGPLTTDAQARIQFKANPGKHIIRVEADGKTSVTSELII